MELIVHGVPVFLAEFLAGQLDVHQPIFHKSCMLLNTGCLPGFLNIFFCLYRSAIQFIATR